MSCVLKLNIVSGITAYFIFIYVFLEKNISAKRVLKNIIQFTAKRYLYAKI